MCARSGEWVSLETKSGGARGTGGGRWVLFYFYSVAGGRRREAAAVTKTVARRPSAKKVTAGDGPGAHASLTRPVAA